MQVGRFSRCQQEQNCVSKDYELLSHRRLYYGNVDWFSGQVEKSVSANHKLTQKALSLTLISALYWLMPLLLWTVTDKLKFAF
jgi:hypothetical protein